MKVIHIEREIDCICIRSNPECQRSKLADAVTKHLWSVVLGLLIGLVFLVI
ncbi:MAG: hypothetical protein ACRDBO_04510 [Lachnospiraceae bacterium]